MSSDGLHHESYLQGEYDAENRLRPELERLRRIETAARAIWQEEDGIWNHHCADGVGACLAVSTSRAKVMDEALAQNGNQTP